MEHYKKALEQIANPVKFLTEEAEKQGNKLNGAAAVAISNDPIWLREIARNALMYNPVTEDKKAPVNSSAEELLRKVCDKHFGGDFGGVDNDDWNNLLKENSDEGIFMRSAIQAMQEYASQERNRAISECIDIVNRNHFDSDVAKEINKMTLEEISKLKK